MIGLDVHLLLISEFAHQIIHTKSKLIRSVQANYGQSRVQRKIGKLWSIYKKKFQTLIMTHSNQHGACSDCIRLV